MGTQTRRKRCSGPSYSSELGRGTRRPFDLTLVLTVPEGGVEVIGGPAGYRLTDLRPPSFDVAAGESNLLWLSQLDGGSRSTSSASPPTRPGRQPKRAVLYAHPRRRRTRGAPGHERDLPPRSPGSRRVRDLRRGRARPGTRALFRLMECSSSRYSRLPVEQSGPTVSSSPGDIRALQVLDPLTEFPLRTS